jgi:nickel-dependent lactate racemase
MKYGSSEAPIIFPGGVFSLEHVEPEIQTSPEHFRKLLELNIQITSSRIESVGIVVADKTRLCQYPLYLPVLTKFLVDSGIPKERFTFHIAYGTHPRQSEEECLHSYGESYQQFRFLHHNSKNDECRHLGTTSLGTEVKISESVFHHDLIISFGAILHHYFAGFGGGRKLFFPGLGSFDSILHNHSLFLDFENNTIQKGCQSGELDDNPLALDLEEIEAMLPDRKEIYAILDSNKQVCQMHMGQDYQAFKNTCKIYDGFFRSEHNREFDLVFASAGGFPKDINFIQAHKSIHNASSFVKDGGKLVIFAECRDGIGNPSFMDIFKLGDRDNIFEALAVEYRNNAGTALAMLEKTLRMDIFMVTSLSEEQCALMGAKKCSKQDAQLLFQEEKGSIAVIKNAGMLYK